MGNSPSKKRPSKAGFQKISSTQNKASPVDIDTDEDDDSGKGNSPNRDGHRKSASLSNHSVREMSVSEMKILVEELMKKNQRLVNEYTNVESELKMKQEEITILKSNKEDAAKKISELQLELGNFLQDCKSEVRQLEERLNEKHAEEMNESKAQIEELVQNNAKQTEEIEELRSQCQELEKRIIQSGEKSGDSTSENESTSNTTSTTNTNLIQPPPKTNNPQAKRTKAKDNKPHQWRI